MFNASIDRPIVAGRKLVVFLTQRKETPQSDQLRLQYDDAVNCLCKIYPNLHRHSAATLLDHLIFYGIVTSVKGKNDYLIIVPC